MLQGEHSAILLTFIKLPFVIKIFVLSIFEWPLKTGFTVWSLKFRPLVINVALPDHDTATPPYRAIGLFETFLRKQTAARCTVKAWSWPAKSPDMSLIEGVVHASMLARHGPVTDSLYV